MTTYVVLAIADDSEAGFFIQDMTEYPKAALLSPVQENTIHARIVFTGKDFEPELGEPDD